MRCSRGRFWNADAAGEDTRAAFTTLYTCLTTLARLLAPITPFLADELHENLVRSGAGGAPDSVHLTEYPVPDDSARDPGLCASAIMSDVPWVVEDARSDPRALANPLVAGEFGLQFYAGVPLKTSDGHNLGTLCVLDFEPRTVTPEEITTLEDLASVVMNELELRLETRRAAR